MRGPIFAIASALALSACALIAPGEPRQLVVINDTGSPITAIYVQEHVSGRWSRNLIGGIAMGQGDRAELDLHTRGCAIDMTLVVEGQDHPLSEAAFDVCAGKPYVTPRFMSFEANGAAAAERARQEASAGAERSAAEAARAAAAREAARGLPICPGDPRCRKK